MSFSSLGSMSEAKAAGGSAADEKTVKSSGLRTEASCEPTIFSGQSVMACSHVTFSRNKV